MATDGDSRLLVARDEGGVSIFDLNAMTEGAPNAQLGFVSTVENGSTGMVVISEDETLALTSEERVARIGVIDLERVREAQFESAYRGSLETDLLPISVFQAPGSKLWFVSCQTTGRDDKQDLMPGTIMAFDADKLISDPGSALRARLVHGNPVRLALSHQEAYVWVTSRAQNQVFCVDVKRFISGDPRPIICTIDVGQAPVGITLAADDRLLVVANSNRFAAPNETGQRLTVIETEAALNRKPSVRAEIVVGAFPRELATDPTSRWIYLTNFKTRTLSLIDAHMLLEMTNVDRE